MSNKPEAIPLKEVLAAVDSNVRNIWPELDEYQTKKLIDGLFVLNRFISSANGKREVQEHHVLTVNEYYNKHWFTLQKHPKLLWTLLCMCSYNNTTQYHEWIPQKKKDGERGKLTGFLSSIYLNKKLDEIELLAQLMTKDEVVDLCHEHGLDDKEIAKILK